MKFYFVALISLALMLGISVEQCGRQAGGAVCPNGLCCSQFGRCGNTKEYCENRCQSQCKPSTTPTPTPPSSGDIGRIITRALFDQLLKCRNDDKCKGKGFYTYDAFLAAAKSFNGFGTTGDDTICKRELAAFLAQTSFQTTGVLPLILVGLYTWGYCFVRELNQSVYCTPNKQYPCAPGRKYYGRGPIQLTHNYNCGPAGKAIGEDLLNNPDLVATNAVVSFKTAMWFWMTPRGNKPSSHDVITGKWKPSKADRAAGRVPGYGVITNIINGGLECGHGPDDDVAKRIGFYTTYADILRVCYGDNLDCYDQRPFTYSTYLLGIKY